MAIEISTINGAMNGKKTKNGVFPILWYSILTVKFLLLTGGRARSAWLNHYIPLVLIHSVFDQNGCLFGVLWMLTVLFLGRIVG